MARSSLFRALRRLGRKQPPPANAGWRRREFLRTFGLAAAALPVLGCGDDTTREGPKIAVIGGGIAGLTASHFLGLAGVRADVYEASMRSGGRMFTQGGLPGGQLVELGGELVDSNHLVVPALCAQLGLQLDDLVEATDGLQQDIFFFNNAKLTETAIVNAFTPVAVKMQVNLLASEGEDDASVAEFERIDAMSIPEWLSTEAGLPASSVIKELLEVAYREEYGLEVDEQSAWNMLFLIDSETPDPFRVFGDSDER
ncbi:MAG: FAD-dependent oxidoreductase, partial [Kofleriaceae bacterium]